MRRSLVAGERSTAPGGALSIADALMAPTPGKVPFALARSLISEGLAVDDDALAAAVAYAARTLKLIIEPGGTAGLAALLAGRFDVRGKAARRRPHRRQLRLRHPCRLRFPRAGRVKLR